MRRAFVLVIVSSFLAACGSSTPAAGPTGPTGPSATASTPSPTPIGPTFSTTPSAPTPAPLPSPSGKGFCTDRSVVDDVVSLVKRADESFQQVALYVSGAEQIIRNDATGAPSSTGAFKIRQLALTLDTLRQAVLGAADNYPDDFSVREWTGSLPGFADKVAAANNCPG
jgi:hypothetical protein